MEKKKEVNYWDLVLPTNSGEIINPRQLFIEQTFNSWYIEGFLCRGGKTLVSNSLLEIKTGKPLSSKGQLKILLRVLKEKISQENINQNSKDNLLLAIDSFIDICEGN